MNLSSFFSSFGKFLSGLFVSGKPVDKADAPAKAPEAVNAGPVIITLPVGINPVTTGHDPDEGTGPWYVRMFNACAIRPGYEKQVLSAVSIVERGFERYKQTAILLGAKDPENFAWILGAIHYKEASCNFDCVLHNGEKIIGTGKKTTLVPKGRGPFTSWEDAAVDAIRIESKKWNELLIDSTDIAQVLWALERYNGTGYISGAGKEDTTPYLWASSNINDGTGKYVADGKYDPQATTLKTVGAAVILKQLHLTGKFKIAG